MADERDEIERLMDGWEERRRSEEDERQRAVQERDAFLRSFHEWAEGAAIPVLDDLLGPVRERGFEVRLTKHPTTMPPSDEALFRHIHLEVNPSPVTFRSYRLELYPTNDKPMVRVHRKLDASSEELGVYSLDDLTEEKVRELAMSVIRAAFSHGR